MYCLAELEVQDKVSEGGFLPRLLFLQMAIFLLPLDTFCALQMHTPGVCCESKDPPNDTSQIGLGTALRISF